MKNWIRRTYKILEKEHETARRYGKRNAFSVKTREPAPAEVFDADLGGIIPVAELKTGDGLRVVISRNPVHHVKVVGECRQSTKDHELEKHVNAMKPICLTEAYVVCDLARPDPPHDNEE
jgi:hypothetical protein